MDFNGIAKSQVLTPALEASAKILKLKNKDYTDGDFDRFFFRIVPMTGMRTFQTLTRKQQDELIPCWSIQSFAIECYGSIAVECYIPLKDSTYIGPTFNPMTWLSIQDSALFQLIPHVVAANADLPIRIEESCVWSILDFNFPLIIKEHNFDGMMDKFPNVREQKEYSMTATALNFNPKVLKPIWQSLTDKCQAIFFTPLTDVVRITVSYATGLEINFYAASRTYITVR